MRAKYLNVVCPTNLETYIAKVHQPPRLETTCFICVLRRTLLYLSHFITTVVPHVPSLTGAEMYSVIQTARIIAQEIEWSLKEIAVPSASSWTRSRFQRCTAAVGPVPHLSQSIP